MLPAMTRLRVSVLLGAAIVTTVALIASACGSSGNADATEPTDAGDATDATDAGRPADAADGTGNADAADASLPCRAADAALPLDATASEQAGIGVCCQATSACAANNSLCVAGRCCIPLHDTGRRCHANSDCCSLQCSCGDACSPDAFAGGECAPYP